MLLLKNPNKNYGINLPREVKELTPEILNSITADVNVSEHYCVIALCYKVKLFDLAANISGGKDTTVTVIPLLAKVNSEDAKRFKVSVGKKIIINRSSIERGDHLFIPVSASSSIVKEYIRDDEEFRKRIVKGGDGSKEIILPDLSQMSKKEREAFDENKSPTVFILEFKIIPVTDITATLPVETIIVDPFRVKDSILVN